MQVSTKFANQTTFQNISSIRSFIQSKDADAYHLFQKLSDVELEKEVSLVTNAKRFLERWQADPNFRQDFLTNPHETVNHYNLNIDSKEIELLWNDAVSSTDVNYSNAPSLERYQKFYQTAKSDLGDIAGSSADSRFKAWRSRQMARCSSQMSKSLHDQLMHSPVCFELSKGCSVGCYFCSISAPRLGDIFFYNETNAKLWREVLELIHKIHKSAAKSGFCYWATDPLDNPDYEKFCSDFYNIIGTFPQTTTAQPLKDPNRTRSLLKLSEKSGCTNNRFSILSLKMLDQLYKEFTPEELTFVKLVLQNPEAGIIKANSGRARQYNKKKAEKNHEVLDEQLPGTNACVSGFLFNMVERSVKLISPCNADDRWKNGYRIYDEGTFTDVNDLKLLLEGMIDKHMPLAVRPSSRIAFRRDLKYESLSDGFQVSTRYKTHRFRSEPYLRQLGEIIHKENKTAQEIASLFNIWGMTSTHIFDFLNLMFDNGVLDDEPKA